MNGNLVIVESPAKAGTIQKFLGKDYIVKPSFGHIRDLQDKKLSVDVENGFAPEYVIPADKKKVVSELKKLADDAQTVWLASDEDREGEAISCHLYETLGLEKKDTKRIVFHAITIFYQSNYFAIERYHVDHSKMVFTKKTYQRTFKVYTTPKS